MPGDRCRATPVYYSMLMFAQAARALVPAHLAPDTSGLKAFAVPAPEGTLRLCLINQNITRDERVVINLGLHDLQERMRAFELALHPAKTRLIRVYGCIHAAAGRTGHRCHRRGDVWRCER